MRNIFNDLILKVTEMPEFADSLRKSLVNRDLAIEIDGKRIQIMRKNKNEEMEKLKDELTRLKARLYDLEAAAKAVLDVHDNDCDETEKLNDILYNE